MHRGWWLVALVASGCIRKGRFECDNSSECNLNGTPGICEPVGFCSFPDSDCGDGRRFGVHSDQYANQCVEVMPDAAIDAPGLDAFPTSCPIPANSRHVWTLALPLNAEYNAQADVPYMPDNRTALAGMVFTRIGYCLQLDTTWVYTEMDDFTSNMIDDTGVPTEKTFQVAVSNLTVRTNSPQVTEVSAVTGNIEMWGNCYGAGGGVFDGSDTITTNQADCYGSFQVHYMTNVLFAWNRWSNNDGNDDLGIGNATVGSNPDWTFATTSGLYAKRELQTFVIP